jgi:hypothetical protein
MGLRCSIGWSIGVADELMDHSCLQSVFPIATGLSPSLSLLSLTLSLPLPPSPSVSLRLSLHLSPLDFSFLFFTRSWIKMQVRELLCFRPMRRAVWPLKLHTRNATRLEITSRTAASAITVFAEHTPRISDACPLSNSQSQSQSQSEGRGSVPPGGACPTSPRIPDLSDEPETS